MTGYDTADLDRSEEAVPVEADSTDYDYLCIRSLGCLVVGDRHARSCVRANDTARVEHYRGLFDEYKGPGAIEVDVVEVIDWHVARAWGDIEVRDAFGRVVQ